MVAWVFAGTGGDPGSGQGGDGGMADPEGGTDEGSGRGAGVGPISQQVGGAGTAGSTDGYITSVGGMFGRLGWGILGASAVTIVGVSGIRAVGASAVTMVGVSGIRTGGSNSRF
jgi:hypothetical protein